MKNVIITACIAVNIICCNTSVKQETKVEEIKVSKTGLPDSLFYKVNMDFFEIPSIPYDESTRTRTLKVITGTLYNEVISGIREMEEGERVNLFYLSKQTEVEKGFLITIYTESEIDPGSIYLLRLNENLTLTDYKKIGYERCDLEQQSDTCEIVACEEIVTYRVKANNYSVVQKNEKEYDCDNGKRKTGEIDSTLLKVKDSRFFFQKL
jgi:hypothetical protein